MMVARDGVERFCVVCFQQLTDSTKDTEDRKDTFCVRFFLRTLPIEIGQTQIRSKNPFRCSRRPMKTMEIIKNAVSSEPSREYIPSRSGVPRRGRTSVRRVSHGCLPETVTTITCVQPPRLWRDGTSTSTAPTNNSRGSGEGTSRRSTWSEARAMGLGGRPLSRSSSTASPLPMASSRRR